MGGPKHSNASEILNKENKNIYSRMEDFGLIEIDEDEIEKTRGTCHRCLRPEKVCLCEYIGIFIIHHII